MTDLNGIILVGGRSTRMGTEKAMIIFQGQYLYQIAVEKLEIFCPYVYLSVNSMQEKRFSKTIPHILDTVENEGPISGLISCLTYLKSPILVLSCDMPLISETEIKTLISNRDQNQICTTFFNEASNFYEPMLSIWETNALSELEDYFNNGGRSIQSFLTKNNITKHPSSKIKKFKNLNTPEDLIIIGT